jgi:putative exporter of polyketide antibiotics
VAGTLIALVTASLFVTSLGPVLRWPDWLVRLSIFTQYGTPMVTGVDWAATARLLMAAAVLLALAAVRFAGKDIGR